MNKIYLYFLILFLPFIFISCEVEFDPNEDWKETTMVYSILDQDADTTFIRVQKCFLGKGNYIEFSKIKDSIYYKEDELEVKMYAYYPWDMYNILKEYDFNYTESYNKAEGEFYSEIAPIYYCVTKDLLHKDFCYKLVITNKKTGNIVSATTKLVANYGITFPISDNFSFAREGTNDIFKMSWSNLKTPSDLTSNEIAKMFQSSIRFNFIENNKLTHIDIPLGKTYNEFKYSREFNQRILSEDILSGLKGLLKNRPSVQRSFAIDNPFDLFIFGCNETMYEYIRINEPSNSLSEKPLYTNIENGVGLFASRRLHIHKKFINADEKIYTAIRSWNVGF